MVGHRRILPRLCLRVRRSATSVYPNQARQWDFSKKYMGVFGDDDIATPSHIETDIDRVLLRDAP